MDGGDGSEERDGDPSDGWLLGGDVDRDEGGLLGRLSGDERLLGGLKGEEGGLLACEIPDDTDEGNCEPGELLLDRAQHPSPNDSTSHWSLSAKCFAMPKVPAGATAGWPDPSLASSGQRTPIESTTLNVRSTGQ